MQLASSIRYGGLLVNARDCDYEAYRNLGLVCPNCHESVFLVQGHERHYSKTSKTTTVNAHFNHRADKSANAIALCELRVKQISPAEIRRRENASKNQRLRLFNRHLWNILQTCYKLDNFAQRQKLVTEGFTKACPSSRAALQVKKGYVSFICDFMSKESDFIISEADFFISNLRSKVTEEQLVLHESLKIILALWRQQIDARMQVEIYKEVVASLLQKKHLPILEKLIEISLHNFIVVTALSLESNLKDEERLQMFNSFFPANIGLKPEIVDGVFQALVETYVTKNEERIRAVYHFVRDDILETIALTPWAEGFEKFSN